MQLTVELLDTEEENSDEPMEAEVRNSPVNGQCRAPLASGTILKPITSCSPLSNPVLFFKAIYCSHFHLLILRLHHSCFPSFTGSLFTSYCTLVQAFSSSTVKCYCFYILSS